ncbi:MAG: hypothetical protein ABEH59_08635 [Halobacteriales archaeon]
MTPESRRVETAIRRFILEEHAETIAAVHTAADAVTADWSTATTTDRSAIVPKYRERLEQAELLAQFPAVLTGAADAADLTLRARPVAAPPYVIVTSTGPILRATAETGRLVIAVRCFDIERGDPTRYRRASTDFVDSLTVSFSCQ